MISLLVLGFGLPVLQGILFVRILFPYPLRILAGRGFNLALSTGIGLGLSSLLYTGYRFFYPAGELSGLLLLDSIFILMLLLIVRQSERTPHRIPIERYYKPELLDAYIRSLFVILLITSLVVFILRICYLPDGQWDTFAIWNLHARFFSRGGDNWMDYFNPVIGWSHPDYPLLISACVARGWQFAESETVLSPALVSAVFTFGTVGIVTGSIGALRGPRSGWMAGIVLLGASTFVQHGAWMQADVPLGFFIVAALAVIAMIDRDENNTRTWAMAGLLCGLAAWTKNEGELFLCVIILISICNLFFRSGPFRQKSIRAGGFVFGILPAALILVWFKTHCQIPNDLLEGQHGQTLQRLLDPARRNLVMQFYQQEILGFGKSPMGIAPILILYTALMVRINAHRVSQAFPAIAVILIMLTGYFGIYLITPHNLYLHLQSSLNRLLLHLWPTLVFAAFLLVNDYSRKPSPGYSG